LKTEDISSLVCYSKGKNLLFIALAIDQFRIAWSMVMLCFKR